MTVKYMTIEPVAVRFGEIVYVPSRTRTGLIHRVDLKNGTCSCEAGQHGRKCWHLDAAANAEILDGVGTMPCIGTIASVPPAQAHRCDDCGRPIEGFTAFRRGPSTWGGKPTFKRFCLGCAEFHDEFRASMKLY